MKEAKYPRGLFFLVFTEFWERFGYYLMIGIFFLYMTTDASGGGFGWEKSTASDIYGSFIALAYLTPFMGGLLADLKLGYRFSVTLGGILMGIGYCLLAVPEKWAFFTSLAVMVVGNGFFKPNIATLLGNLYNDPRFVHKKDTGYNIFYMGINLGAFICNFIAAIMRNQIGWHGAFITAGIGMFIGVITFWLGMKHYKHVDVRKEPRPEDRVLLNRFMRTLLIGLICALAGWFYPDTVFGSDSTDAFFMFCVPVVFFYSGIFKQASEEERKPLGTMFTIFLIVILFWAIFKQNGTALTTYAESYTDRAVPERMVPLTKSLGFSEQLLYEKKERKLSDSQFRTLRDAKGEPLLGLDYPAYFKNLEESKRPPEGRKLNLINTEIFQSINPFFVIALTPLLIAFFALLSKRKKEPTTATKIAYGLLVSALSTLVMVLAVYATGNGAVKASAWWLISCYGVVTVGELLLSPMGLSMVSKLAPARLTALMMGGWQLATSVGNKLSGVLAKNWDKFDNKALYFWLNFALLMLAFAIMLFMLRRLNRVFRPVPEI
ncbi:MAG TPA: peptide MFS transporter [Bacteroidia bacterium]|nr:peptide MFS transporter [Bacteroidia bacterium]